MTREESEAAGAGRDRPAILHSLNQPLSILVSNLALIEDDLQTLAASGGVPRSGLLEGLRELVAESREASDRLAQLVGDLAAAWPRSSR